MITLYDCFLQTSALNEACSAESAHLLSSTISSQQISQQIIMASKKVQELQKSMENPKKHKDLTVKKGPGVCNNVNFSKHRWDLIFRTHRNTVRNGQIWAEWV